MYLVLLSFHSLRLHPAIITAATVSTMMMRGFSVSPRLEVSLRVALVTLITSALSVAYIPSAVPPALSQLIGIFGAAFALSLPHVLFIIGAAIPLAIVAIVVGLLGGTALLAAATVSNGVYVAVFAIYALYCTSLSYGPDASKTSSFSNILIVSAGLLSLGSWQLVQNGLQITVDFPYEQGNSTQHFLANAIAALSEKICGAGTECAEELATLVPPGRIVAIPGDSNFAGQDASISCEDFVCTITVPGGLWFVSGFWTWQGLNNPLAVFRNFLICMCWALLVICIGIALPPIRTMRKVYAQGIVPTSIADSTALIEARAKELDGQYESSDVVDNANGNKDLSEMEEKCIHHAIENASGGKAPLTAYEPRCCANPLECTWPLLKHIGETTNRLALAAIGCELRLHFSERETSADKEKFKKDIELLKSCSDALRTLDIDAFASAESRNQTALIDEEGGSIKEDEFSYFVRSIGQITKEMMQNTNAWLNAMHKPRYSGMKDLAMSYLPWVLPIFVFLKSLFANLLLPFQPKRWNMRSFVTAVKFASGVVILVVCEVYWVQYRGFAVGESKTVAPEAPNGPIAVTLDSAPTVFSGWNLLSYILATTATSEGTVKKGFFRMLGTASGAFMGWLAIIICSGSYDSSTPVNMYALVAWLTLTTGVVAYFSIPPGPAAFFGLGQNAGMAGMYIAMTQALVALEVALDVGERDIIVSNRVVATVTGVLMAMIVAVIPPQRRGSDVEPIKALLQEIEEAFASGCRIMLEEGRSGGEEAKKLLDDLREEFTEKAHQTKSKIDFLLKDASQLGAAPFFQVDERLSHEMEAIAVTAVYVIMFLEFAAHVAMDDEVTLVEKELSTFKEEMNGVLRRVECIGKKRYEVRMDGVDDGNEHADNLPAFMKQIGSEREEPDLLLNAARFLCDKLEKQELIVANIEKGPKGRT